MSDKSFDEILETCEIEEIRRIDKPGYPSRYQFLIKQDRTFFIVRFPIHLDRMSSEWSSFKILSDDSKKAIINAVLDNKDHSMRYVRYKDENFDIFIADKEDVDNEDDA